MPKNWTTKKPTTYTGAISEAELALTLAYQSMTDAAAWWPLADYQGRNDAHDLLAQVGAALGKAKALEALATGSTVRIQAPNAGGSHNPRRRGKGTA